MLERERKAADKAYDRLTQLETDRKELADEYIVLKSNHIALTQDYQKEVRLETRWRQMLGYFFSIGRSLIGNRGTLNPNLKFLTSGGKCRLSVSAKLKLVSQSILRVHTHHTILFKMQSKYMARRGGYTLKFRG